MDTSLLDISATQEIYSVSQLNREARFLLESSFPPLWVEGEISNFSMPNSGHWYFSLKDSGSQIRCAMFKPQNRRIEFIPKDGMQVLLKARVTLYEGRGEFQLVAEHLEEAGLGKLQQAFEALKKRLHANGLFDLERKKPLPRIPKCIGIITSPTGAAIRDVLTVLKRRLACVPIIIYPSQVQGHDATPQIVRAIQRANARVECDVLLVTRGGGSLEDLWCFNEESVAMAIYHSKIPIVNAVGHEVDFTIADFVADLRAPTPSAAAELLTPDCTELTSTLEFNAKQFLRIINQQLQDKIKNLMWFEKQLEQQHPRKKLITQQQFCDEAEITLTRLIKNILKTNNQNLANAASMLNTLSPLSTLSRGYAIATRVKDGAVLYKAQDVKVNEKVKVALKEGELECVVTNNN